MFTLSILFNLLLIFAKYYHLQIKIKLRGKNWRARRRRNASRNFDSFCKIWFGEQWASYVYSRCSQSVFEKLIDFPQTALCISSNVWNSYQSDNTRLIISKLYAKHRRHILCLNITNGEALVITCYYSHLTLLHIHLVSPHFHQCWKRHNSHIYRSQSKT